MEPTLPSGMLLKGALTIAADPGGFPIWGYLDFREKLNFGISLWDLGSGRVCNGLEMAVGFKWTDSQPISTNMNPFGMIFMISVILLSFSMV